jgi:hypothetical protein
VRRVERKLRKMKKYFINRKEEEKYLATDEKHAKR